MVSSCATQYMSPKVCICIPCYNNGQTIAETLRSIFDQSYQNIVIKVLDNASSDNTREIVRSFFCKGRNIALSTRTDTIDAESNLTKCIEAAEGDYTAIFHADDVYEPSILAEQIDFLDKNKACVAVSANAGLIDGDGKLLKSGKFVPYELRQKMATGLAREEMAKLVFKYGNFITCPSVLFRTDILARHIKQFNGSTFKTSADLDVWFRLTEVGSFGFINKPLMRYRMSNASYSHRSVRLRVEDSSMFLVLNDFLDQNIHAKQSLLNLRSYKDFLLMRDRALTNVNRFLARQDDFQEIPFRENLSLIFVSRFHFRYFAIALLVRMLVMFPAKVVFRYLLRKIWYSDRFLARFR